MRTTADRKEVLRVFEEVFKATPSINPYPRVQLNSDNLFVGNVAIKRNITQFYTTSSSHLLIQPKICQSLEVAALCVERQWLCILVGLSCSGNTKLLRLLASLTGNVLNEVNLSSATDISELLGSFEQYDALRNFRTVVAQVESYVNEFCSLQLEVSNGVTFKEHLNWEAKSELKVEVLHGIKEIGRVLYWMGLLDIVLRETDTTNSMQTAPWLGLIPGADEANFEENVVPSFYFKQWDPGVILEP